MYKGESLIRKEGQKMKIKTRKSFIISICTLVAFVLWTAAILLIDVQRIGPQDSAVGFATVNRFFHELTDVHMTLYEITDMLSLVPLGVVLEFAVMGLVQWIKRGRLLAVDRSILILGGFYVVVMAAFLLFEVLEVNYRPVLIEGQLEASYPSSTTMLVLCVMPTAILQIKERISRADLRLWLTLLTIAFTALMVVLRFLSGVHWLTDIVGGVLLSAGLVSAYCAATEAVR